MESLKLNANEFYKQGKYEIAFEKYKECETLSSSQEDELILSKNKVACLVKMKKYQEALTQCQKIIEILPFDAKTLYRMALCLKEVGRLEDSLTHLRTLIKIEGNKKVIMDLMDQLNRQICQKTQSNLITIDKLEEIVRVMQDKGTEETELINSIKKLHYIGSSAIQCSKITKFGGLKALFSLFLYSSYPEVRITACHCVKDLSINSDEIANLVFEWLVDDVKFLMKGNISNVLVEAIWGLSDSLLLGFKSSTYTTKFAQMAIAFVDSNKLGVFGRNRLLLFLIKHLKDASTVKLVEETDAVDAVLNLIDVKVTNELVLVNKNTLDLAKALLSTLYDGLGGDKWRKVFKEKCKEHFSSLLTTVSELDESHVVSIEMISTLLQSVPDVASDLLCDKDDLFNFILMVIDDDEEPTKKELIAVLDCLIFSVSIKKLALAHSEAIFCCFNKYLVSDYCDSVRIRALVGLGKAQSIDGFTNSLSAESKNILSTEEVTKSVLQVLSGRKQRKDDGDLFDYAVQAMLFISLSADSKELLVNDKGALSGIVKSCHNESHSLYPVSQILVNVTNSYDRMDADENLVKLAKFTKEKVPEKHPKDDEEFVKERIAKLVEAGIFKALNNLSSQKSAKIRENASRVFLTIMRYEKYRGLASQIGCVKTLLKLTDEFDFAKQAVARIGITANPAVIFPDQTMFQVVRPLVELLCVSKTPLQNFEALLALGNLASVSDDVRKCIMSNKGFHAVESCMFNGDPRIQLAATQCMCNMAMLEDVVDLHAAPENDRVKLLVLFTAFIEEEVNEQTIDLILAAAGALAILSDNETICQRICAVNKFQERLMSGLSTGSDGIFHRILYIVRNLLGYGTKLSTEFILAIKAISLSSTSSSVVNCAKDIIKLVNIT